MLAHTAAGHRTIGAQFGIPADKVRGWIRRRPNTTVVVRTLGRARLRRPYRSSPWPPVRGFRAAMRRLTSKHQMGSHARKRAPRDDPSV